MKILCSGTSLLFRTRGVSTVQEEQPVLTSASSPALLYRSFRGISDMNYTETELIVFAVRAFYVGLCVLGEFFTSCWRHAAELALGCVMQENASFTRRTDL